MKAYDCVKNLQDHEISEVLEQFIDRESINLSGLFDEIIGVCLNKAEHLRTNWNDAETANLWESVAQQINDNLIVNLPNGF
jgi:hypothetical protein